MGCGEGSARGVGGRPLDGLHIGALLEDPERGDAHTAAHDAPEPRGDIDIQAIGRSPGGGDNLHEHGDVVVVSKLGAIDVMDDAGIDVRFFHERSSFVRGAWYWCMQKKTRQCFDAHGCNAYHATQYGKRRSSTTASNERPASGRGISALQRGYI